MVTTESRNNLIIIFTIVAFSIIVASFILAFAQNLEKTSKEGMIVVQIAADNVTTSTRGLVDAVKYQGDVFDQGFDNLTMVLNKQYNLTVQEREQQEKNLGVFLKAFANQTKALVDTINEQKVVFVDTLEKSQNLTKTSQNLTKENQEISLTNQNFTKQRNMLLEKQTEQFDEILQLLRDQSNTMGDINGSLKLQTK